MYNGPVIDCDVHHTWRDPNEVMAYLPKDWREYVRDLQIRLGPPMANFAHPGRADIRLDSFPDVGGPPGSDYETTRSQLLDGQGVTRALLGFDIGHEVAHANPFFAAELARAANDWSIEHWLSTGDKRLRGKVLVANHIPESAAKEIYRVGGHPQIAEVLMVTNGLGQPFGHTVYDPIFRAAADMELSLGIHVAAGWLHKRSNYVAGMPSTRLEYHSRAPETHMHHLTSMITHGTFERFPSLKVMLIECGVAWLPWLLMGMDANYSTYRRESPWVKKLPSEYFKHHFAVTTQPFDASPNRMQLIDLLEALGGMDDILCFSTDYPHWDFDDPKYIARRIPAEWREKVFYRNAARFYGWDVGELESDTIAFAEQRAAV